MSLEEIRNYINEVRRSFSDKPLNKSSVLPDPFDQFSLWFEDAVNAQILDPYAMVVASVSEQGFPSSRAVYMRDISTDGLVFYTNYTSQKGKEILNNPAVSLLFLWIEIDRQIRISGRAEKISSNLSDIYFASRPRESQLGAWCSEQSEVLSSREELLEKYSFYDEKFRGLEIPRPENWGGFIVRPDKMEFWQGRPNRLHDRILYLKDIAANTWKLERLAP